jgi:hypothetical protein
MTIRHRKSCRITPTRGVTLSPPQAPTSSSNAAEHHALAIERNRIDVRLRARVFHHFSIPALRVALSGRSSQTPRSRLP